MRTGKFELVIIWSNGDKEIWEYQMEEEAKEVEEGMYVAVGNQISWSCVRPQMF